MTSAWQEELREASLEILTLQEGWNGLDRGYYCMVEKDGLCIEDFGPTRPSAIRRASRAWRKERDKKLQQTHGYPRVRDCAS